MASDRIFGEDVVIIVSLDGTTQQITGITEFDFTEKGEIKKADHLGKTSPDFDETYDGVEGNIGIHVTRASFDFMVRVRDRQKRRTPGVVTNIQATCSFPDGRKKRITFNDVKWGSFPVNVGGRTEYVTMKTTWATGESDYA